jgi:hypothetical protein
MVVAKPQEIEYFRINLLKNNTKNYSMYGSNETEPFKNSHYVPTFTFVRNPLQRFESSLAEAVWRTDIYHTRRNMSNYIVNSTDMVKGYIHEILNMQPSSLRDIFHIYPMSGVLFRYNIDIIGYLETFKENFEKRVLPKYNLDLVFNYRYGVHATAVNHPIAPLHKNNKNFIGDPSQLRMYYQKLMSEEPAYLRALCNLYMVDFMCLPKFELPEQCRHLESIRSLGVDILRRI